MDGNLQFVKRGGLKSQVFKITYLFSQNTKVLTRLKFFEFSSPYQREKVPRLTASAQQACTSFITAETLGSLMLRWHQLETLMIR